MAKELGQILGFRNLLGLITAVKDGLAEEILDRRLLRRTKSTIGNKGTYFKVEGNRQTAKQVMYGAPSVSRKLRDVTEVNVTLLHAFEHITHSAATLIGLKSTDDLVQQMAMEHISRQVKNFATLFTNTRIAAWFAALTSGHIFFDKDGGMLPNVHGAVIDVDFNIPAGNKGQIDALGAGAIVTGAWATGTTDIASQIADLQKAAVALSGYRIRTCYYGKNIASYIAGNDSMKEFLKMQPRSNANVLTGKVPKEFLDIEWRPAYEAMYQDDGGTNHFFWKDSMCVFTPSAADDGWWGMLEGTYPIPAGFDAIAADAADAAKSINLARGIFSYAKIIDDPVAIKHHGGDTFLPFISVPKSVFIADDVT